MAYPAHGNWSQQILETSGLVVRVSELINIGRQPMLLATSRCYSIQMLRSALTCTNGCSC
jgi:hypothetical protein